MKQLAILLFILASCATPIVVSGSAPDVGFVKFDGATLIVYGEVSIDAEMYTKVDGVLIYPPLHGEKGKWHVVRFKGKDVVFNESGEIGTPLPAFTADLFKPGEAEDRGIIFE